MTTMPQRESTIAAPDDARKQLGAFLRARRESLDPQRLGLPRVGRRRTPGLRREEVAMLAEVGVTWYTWLEQGREVNPSEAVLVSVANALQCSPLETRHLFVLAGLTPPEAAQVTVCEGISPGTRRMLDSLMSPISARRWRSTAAIRCGRISWRAFSPRRRSSRRSGISAMRCAGWKIR